MRDGKFRKELASQLPNNFDREVVVMTEKLDLLDLIDRTSKASSVLNSQLAALPDKALLGWRPPYRGWSIWVPTAELNDIDFKYRLQHGDWSCVPLHEYLENRERTPVVADCTETKPYYTVEQIYHGADINLTLGDKLTAFIAGVLVKVPKDVVDDIFENCTYLMLTPQEIAAYIPNRILKGRHVILLPYELLGWSKEKQIETILHETAHFALRHRSPIEDFDLDYDQQEDEAWALVKQ
jgi:hypothetical protein